MPRRKKEGTSEETSPIAAAVAPLHGDAGRKLAHLIFAAEQLFPTAKSGPTKKKWVVDRLNEFIDIPLLNEDTERQVLGVIVDIVVGSVLNAVR